MNLPVFFIAIGVASVGAYLYASHDPVDVYRMPVDVAYARLANVDFGPMGEGEKVLNTRKVAVGNGTDSVDWTTRGDMARHKCTMYLRPLPDDAAKTHVQVSCGTNKSAIVRLELKLYRNEIVERVDAALRQATYQRPQLGFGGIPGWPDEGVDSLSGNNASGSG